MTLRCFMNNAMGLKNAVNDSSKLMSSKPLVFRTRKLVYYTWYSCTDGIPTR